MTTTEISTSLTALQTRRTALAAQLTTARGTVATVQAGLITGTSTPADVASAQGNATALSSALDALDGQIHDTQAQLSQSQAADAHAASISRCVDLANQGQAAQATFDAAYADACTVLQAKLDILLTQGDVLSGLKTEFEQRLQYTSATNADLELVKVSADPSALLVWGGRNRRPAVFDLFQGTSYDVEVAYNRAFLMRDQQNRR